MTVRSGFFERGPVFMLSDSVAGVRGLSGISPDQFATRFVRDWGLTVSAEAFLPEFESWTRGLYPGAQELLGELRSRYRLAALSNSNSVHWRRNDQVLGVNALFERAFSSHDLGLHKPAPEIFERVLEALDVEPQTVAFFDDLSANVDAASRLGMTARRVEGIAGLRTGLADAGLHPGQDRHAPEQH